MPPWAEATRATLGRMCPTSLKVTLRQLRLGRALPYDAMKDVEFRLSQHCTARPDFREGIRAAVIDKDKSPRWSPPTLAEVDPARIGIWGSSNSGGHVVLVGAQDRRVKAVISQVGRTARSSWRGTTFPLPL